MTRPKELKVRSPKEIFRFLSERVVGQESAKRAVAIAVRNHLARVNNNVAADAEKRPEKLIEKANVLLLGPSGSGKTLIAMSVSQLAGVPFTIADATRITPAGYVGADAEHIFVPLLAQSEGDIARAEAGIVFLDEVDKIEQKANGHEVRGVGVQQALLKLIEGCTVRLPKADGTGTIELRTHNILFICAGAFPNLPGIIARRLRANAAVGFTAPVRSKEELAQANEHMLDQVVEDDLIAYGFLAELVGRLQVRTTLHPLTEDDLVAVLTEPTNNIIEQVTRLLYPSVRLSFTDAALREIAREAIACKTGARALVGIVNRVIEPFNFDLSPSRVLVTPEMVKGAKPRVWSIAGRLKT